MPKSKNPSYRELKRAVEEHPAPWSVAHVVNDLYDIQDNDGLCLGVTIPHKLARRIVAAINEREAK